MNCIAVDRQGGFPGDLALEEKLASLMRWNALAMVAREKLDNLVWVVNCNLQRLDGLFARDTTGALVRAFADTVDGRMQTFAAKDGRFNRDNFFGQNEELQRLAQGLSDEQIDRLKRGGHDIVKIHAASLGFGALAGSLEHRSLKLAVSKLTRCYRVH